MTKRTFQSWIATWKLCIQKQFCSSFATWPKSYLPSASVPRFWLLQYVSFWILNFGFVSYWTLIYFNDHVRFRHQPRHRVLTTVCICMGDLWISPCYRSTCASFGWRSSKKSCPWRNYEHSCVFTTCGDQLTTATVELQIATEMVTCVFRNLLKPCLVPQWFFLLKTNSPKTPLFREMCCTRKCMFNHLLRKKHIKKIAPHIHSDMQVIRCRIFFGWIVLHSSFMQI